MKRRNTIKGLVGLTIIGPTSLALMSSQARSKLETNSLKPPILVVLELSGGNDGLNTVVPYGDDLSLIHI